MHSSLRADWVLPIAGPPLEGGSVTIEDGRIVAVEPTPPPGATNLGRRVLMPGLVNAHTHLELSYLRGRIPRAPRYTDWVRPLLAARRTPPDPETVAAGATEAVGDAVESGTVLFGDVANSLGAVSALRASRMAAHVFYELLGFNTPEPVARVTEARARIAAEQLAVADDGLEIRFSVAAHAPYSVSPALFREIAAQASGPLAVHLGESPEEVEFLRTGLGPIRQTLESLGVWNGEWRVPECDPVSYIADLGYLQPGALVVHGVHLTDDALERLRDADATLITCPRSNLWVGSGPPRLSHFYACGVPVAVGTDSLASVATLNLWDELAEMRRLAPDVAPECLLESATRIGAEGLGFGDDFGTLTAGKRAALVAVDVPAAVGDVEEYLVSGVPADRVRRVA